VTVTFTPKQMEAQVVMSGVATHILLEGGGRSGKTFLTIRNIVMRALKAPKSRHAVLRFRFNHLKASIIADTFPKVMELCFPGVTYKMNQTDWYAELPNAAQIWFGGLDDKARTEKILGQEYVTAYLNECSQISWTARELVKTRLAQQVNQTTSGGGTRPLPLRMYYDCNPPSKGHWTYKLFHKGIDPEDLKPLRNPENFAYFRINPRDNTQNIAAGYLAELEQSSFRYRKRFLDGEYADENPNALFAEETIDRNRVIDGRIPELIRVVVAVDPSGSDDVDNIENDEIGIMIAGLGTDGKAYLLEDCTVKAGPATWGRIATDGYDRHQANIIVAEDNYGGAMVKHTIQTARPGTPFKAVKATRGKAVRAEPVSALYEQGRVCHVGYFRQLEDELTGFSTMGYMGDRSPNRADALVWALTELFPGMITPSESFDRPKGFQSPYTRTMGIV
jgi:predicted phage terminase large subunit-like protein